MADENEEPQLNRARELLQLPQRRRKSRSATREPGKRIGERRPRPSALVNLGSRKIQYNILGLQDPKEKYSQGGTCQHTPGVDDYSETTVGQR